MGGNSPILATLGNDRKGWRLHPTNIFIAWFCQTFAYAGPVGSPHHVFQLFSSTSLHAVLIWEFPIQSRPHGTPRSVNDCVADWLVEFCRKTMRSPHFYNWFVQEHVSHLEFETSVSHHHFPKITRLMLETNHLRVRSLPAHSQANCDSEWFVRNSRRKYQMMKSGEVAGFDRETNI
jgi:hypothetical protein